MNVKYEKEVRFDLGVALVKMPNREVIEKYIKVFDHTKQTILVENDWQK